MIDFIPLHLNAFEQSPDLQEWLNNCFGRLTLTFLMPEGWYTLGHTSGNFVWAPPPAAGELMIEQLGKARLIRSYSLHVIVIPQLLTGYWHQVMIQECDLTFQIDFGFTLWKKDVFEPLTCFVCLQCSPDAPNWLKESGQGKLEALLGDLRSKELWKEPPERGGAVLCKLLECSRELDAL